MNVVPRESNAPPAPESAAQAALFARESGPMVRMATLMTGSAAAAEEVVQDAFAAVVERWAAVDRPGAYLRTTVVNGCAQFLRRRAIESRLVPTVDPPRTLELPTQLLELRDALDRLAARQRLVVVLRYFVDVDDREIAAMLGIRPSTVRSTVRRALHILRKELS